LSTFSQAHLQEAEEKRFVSGEARETGDLLISWGKDRIEWKGHGSKPHFLKISIPSVDIPDTVCVELDEYKPSEH